MLTSCLCIDDLNNKENKPNYFLQKIFKPILKVFFEVWWIWKIVTQLEKILDLRLSFSFIIEDNYLKAWNYVFIKWQLTIINQDFLSNVKS